MRSPLSPSLADLPRSLRRAVLALPLVAALAACSDALAPGATPSMSVSFTTRPAAGAAVTSGGVRVVSGADTLVITSVEVAFTKIELTRAGAVCGDTATSGSDDCLQIRATPTLVSLPLDGSVAQTIRFAAPPGTYTAIEAKVRPIDPDKASRPYFAQFIAENPDFRYVTVRARGTFRGQAFTYTAPVDTDIEMYLGTLTVGEGAADAVNLTVNVDVAAWFRSPSGLIDPNSANVGGMNFELVAENIERSFEAFNDCDLDGSDDDGTPDQGGGHR